MIINFALEKRYFSVVQNFKNLVKWFRWQTCVLGSVDGLVSGSIVQTAQNKSRQIAGDEELIIFYVFKVCLFIFFVFPYFVPASLFNFFILCRLAFETSLAKSQETKNSFCMSLKCVFSFSLYFLILCRLVFLFSLFCAVWPVRTKSRQIAGDEESIFYVFKVCLLIFFVFPYFVPASLFIFFILCRLAIETSLAKSHETKNSFSMSLKCAFSFSLYFLILCQLVFLFSLFCAIWLSKQVSPNRRRLRIHFVPASLFIFFILCRLADRTKSRQIAGDRELIFYIFKVCLLIFLCISIFCAG